MAIARDRKATSRDLPDRCAFMLATGLRIGEVARMIAVQLGHSRVSMTQDVYLGRGAVDPRVVQALEAADPNRGPQSVGQSDGSAAPSEGA